jgi:hypothetical protein
MLSATRRRRAAITPYAIFATHAHNEGEKRESKMLLHT